MLRITLLAAASLLAVAGTAHADGKPAYGTYGFDTAGMDASVRPGNDYYAHANGTWAKNTAIPADRSNYGMFTVLDDLSRERVRAIIEEMAAGTSTDADARKIGTLYATFMDEAAIEKAGLAPVKPMLDRIAAATTPADIAALMGRMTVLSSNNPFPFYVAQDEKKPEDYIATFVQYGLGLPDRDYYLEDNPAFKEAREKYKAHIARMLAFTGVSAGDAATKAAAIYALEESMARAHWSQIESRDRNKTYNKWTLADFQAKAPGVDWPTYMKAVGLDKANAYIVSQPSAFTGMAAVLAKTPLPVVKDYLTYHYLSGSADFLPKAVVEEDFDFNGRVLSGTPELKPRWKRGGDFVEMAMGEAVGRIYVQRHFPPEAKAAADKLVKNILLAYEKRIDGLAWMSPETKKRAHAKLAKFTPKIGYPDKWRDYAKLEVVAGDALGNAERAATFEHNRNIAKLGQPIDRGEWFMTPYTINAYYNPQMNEIVFPAAILQPPFFDPNADDAVNYGGIGAVIGHEISHGFDDQGAKSDGDGLLTDWWTPEDKAKFEALGDKLSAQYDAYCPFDKACVKGKLTLGENIGDLGGLTVAHEAYLLSLGGKPSPVIDGKSGDQRFFEGWAQVWRRNYREPELRKRLVTDPHSPSQYRTNGIVRNMDQWYAAYGIKPGDALYLKPEDRVKIW